MSYRKGKPVSLGKGSIVRLKQQFGLNEVPVGTKGKIIGYYGNVSTPFVRFDSHPTGNFVVPLALLEPVSLVPSKEPKVYSDQNRYYDDGEGYQFYYDIEVPEYETETHKIRVDGLTEETITEKLQGLDEEDEDHKYYLALLNIIQNLKTRSFDEVKTYV